MWKKRTLKATSVALLSVMAFGFAGMTTTEASSRRPPEPPRYEQHQDGPHGDRDMHARPTSHENVRHRDDHRNPPPPPEKKKKKSNNSTNVAIAAVAGAVVGAVIAKNT